MEPSTSNDDSVSSYWKNKLKDAVRSTKESAYALYTDEIKQPRSAGNVEQSDTIPDDSMILLYPAFTKVEAKDEYITRIKGSIFCPGTMSTKNRLLLGLAQRLSRPSSANPQLGDELETELKDAIVNQDSLDDGSQQQQQDQASITSSIHSLTSDTVKERMRGILSRQIHKTPLEITVSSKDNVDKLIAAKLYSDGFGMFEISLVTSYEPSYVVVASSLNDNIIQTINTTLVHKRGVSVITDIDDTVRETGVLGDKRDVFRNIFAKPYSECEIPQMCSWLTELHDEYQCAIHYVSNSPWQIYNIIDGFLNSLCFPITSVHLRQYSGNLISSFTQPSAERKRPSMVNLLNDFPERKFILIGDSGEQDLEAYLSLLPTYKNQIKAIYIRIVPSSLSSLGKDDEVFKELQLMLSTRGITKADGSFWNNPTGIDSDDEPGYDNDSNNGRLPKLSETLNDISTMGVRKSINKNVDDVANGLINTTYDVGVGVGVAVASHDTRSKLKPLVPKKPAILQGNRLRRMSKTDNDESLPKLVKTRTMSWSKDTVNTLFKMGEKVYSYPKAIADENESDSAISPPPPPLPRRKTPESLGGFQRPEPLSEIANAPPSAASATSAGNSTLEYRSSREDQGRSSNYANGYRPGDVDLDDKRRILWKAKINRILNEVPDDIDVKLWKNVNDVHEQSIKVVIANLGK